MTNAPIGGEFEIVDMTDTDLFILVNLAISCAETVFVIKTRDHANVSIPMGICMLAVMVMEALAIVGTVDMLSQ